MNHDNSQPVAPVGPSQSAGQQGHPVPTPPKKKMSKKVRLSIIGGGIALVVVGIVIALVVALGSLASPSKQDYQDAITASLETTSEYTSYSSAALDRAMLDYTTSMQNQAIANQNLQNIDLKSFRITGEIKPYLSVSETRLAALEANEREQAKKVAEKERALDDAMSKLGDKEAAQGYGDYKALRAKLYGQGRTAEQYVESMIAIARIQYACADTVSASSLGVITVEDARKLVLVTEGCISGVREALEGDALAGKQRPIVELLNEFMSEMSDILIAMIDSGSIDSSKLDAVSEKYESRLDTEEQDESVSVDGLSDSLYKLNETLVAKRDAARGELSSPTSQLEGRVPGVGL